MIYLRYLFGALITVPLLPLLYVQGRKVKNKVPDLPEASGNEGVCGNPSDPILKLLVVGESTMAGVGVRTHDEGFAGTLSKELAMKNKSYVHWKVYAKSGITASRVPNELLRKIEEKNWDLIVIGLGGNDAFKLNSPSNWKSKISELILACRNLFGEVPVVFTNMPPIKEFPAFTPLMKFSIGNLVEILGESLKQVVGGFTNVYYSSEKITIQKWEQQFRIDGHPNDYFSDGVHPSQLTYQLLAKQMADYITSKVEI